MTKIMTINDLYSFFSQKSENVKFNSKIDNKNLFVRMDGMFETEEYDADEFRMFAKLRLCHTGENRNGSYFEKKTIKEAIPSLYNMPILAEIKDFDGELDFTTHSYYQNDDGEIEYIEKPVGVVPESCKPSFVYDEEKDKTYLEATGIIYKEYSKASEIMERKGTTKISIEVSIDELSYNAKDRVMIIDKFHFLGVTLLGKNVDSDGEIYEVEEGMEGANATIEDFSVSTLPSNYADVLANFEKRLSDIENKTCRKEEIGEMLDIEKFEENESVETEVEKVETTEVEETENEDVKTEETTEDETETEVENSNDEAEVENTDEETDEESSEDYSVTYSATHKGKVLEYSVTLTQKLNALYELVNDTYCEDGDWYSVDADDKFVYMYGWYHSYKQKYRVRKDIYSLVGDREEVFATWLTQEEIDKLEESKAEFERVSKELDGIKKDNFLNSESFDVVRNTTKFKELCEKKDEFALDELKEKANYIKEVAESVQEYTANTVNRKTFSVKAEVEGRGRYGGLSAK